MLSENNKIDYVCLLTIENGIFEYIYLYIDTSHYLPIVLITKINNNIYFNNNEEEQISMYDDVDKCIENLLKYLQNSQISWNKSTYMIYHTLL